MKKVINTIMETLLYVVAMLNMLIFFFVNDSDKFVLVTIACLLAIIATKETK